MLLRTCLLLLLIGNAGLADDWPQWRGPHRNGCLPGPSLFQESTQLNTAWTAEVGTGFSGLAVTEEVLVTMGNQNEEDVVTCLHTDSGEVIWSFRYPAPLDPNLFEGGPTSTPAIVENRAITISRQGLVHCLELSSGNLIWKYDIVKELGDNVPTWGFSGSPLIVGESLFLNAGSHGICLMTLSGKLGWSSSNDADAGYSSPLLVQNGDESLLVMMNSKAINGIHPKTGELLWSERWITRYGINAADPLAIAPGRLLVSSGYGKGTGLVDYTANSSSLTWRNREVKTQMSPGVFSNGSVYTIDGDEGDSPSLVCFAPDSGDVHWRKENFGAGSIVAVGSQILILKQSGELLILESNSTQFQVVATHPLPQGKYWTPLSVVGNRIYTRNSSGKVNCSHVQ